MTGEGNTRHTVTRVVSTAAVLVAAVAAMAMLVALAGCGAKQGTTADGTDNGDVIGAVGGDIWASIDQQFAENKGVTWGSWDEYMDEEIDRFKSSRDDPKIKQADPDGTILARQLEVMEQIKQAGHVTAEQYEGAWADYKSCMLERGYKEILLERYPNGLYREANHHQGTAEQEERYYKDQSQCMALNVSHLDSIYEQQVGNPNLFKNPFEGVLDCLRKANLTPEGYGMDDLKYDMYEATSRDKLKLDVYQADAQACFLGNDMVMGNLENAPTETLW